MLLKPTQPQSSRLRGRQLVVRPATHYEVDHPECPTRWREKNHNLSRDLGAPGLHARLTQSFARETFGTMGGIAWPWLLHQAGTMSKPLESWSTLLEYELRNSLALAQKVDCEPQPRLSNFSN
jgi:hypothetical protein